MKQLILILILATAVSACGKKGDVKPPKQASASASLITAR